jgi:hypothetical protein
MRDFGLAGDAATTAKRMQNGAAVEANLSSTLGQLAAGGRTDDRNHFGKRRPKAPTEPVSPPQIAVSAGRGPASQSVATATSCDSA